MNLGQIKAQVQEETAITDYNLDTALPILQSRLDRLVRLEEQVGRVLLGGSVWSLSADGRGRHTVPADYVEIVELLDAQGNPFEFSTDLPLDGDLYFRSTTEYLGKYSKEGRYLYTAPAATAADTYTLVYYQRMDALVDANDENDLAQLYPDTYVNGLVSATYKAHGDVEMAQVYETELVTSLEEIKKDQREKAGATRGLSILAPANVV